MPTQPTIPNNLTPKLSDIQIRQNIDALKASGMATQKIQEYVNNYQKSADGTFVLKGSAPTTQPAPVEKPSSIYGGQMPNRTNLIGKAFGEGIQQVKEAGQEIVGGESGMKVDESLLKGGAGIVNAAFSPLAPVMKPVGDIVQKLGDMIGSTQAAQDFVTQHPEATQTLERLATATQNASTIAGGVLGAGQIAKSVPTGVSKVGGAIESGAKAVKESTASLSDAILKNDPAKMDEYINTQYTKAIKPSITGKTAPGQIEKYNANVNDAIKTIVQNKPNLQLTDEFGEATGKLPQTVDQFRQAIEQSKANIFKQYDSMAKTAGDQGATVDLIPAADELDKVVNNKVVQDLHPELARYAKERADALRTRSSYSTEEAQTAVQNLNRSLDAFYKNPSYETASRASVDSLVANQLRQGLDTSIESAGAPGYQELKNQYASLKAIEKDVIKRGIIEARQTGGRGMTVGDIVSAEELVRGLATMNPQALVTAGAIKGIAALRNYLTSPNRAVRLLFEKAEATNQTSSNLGMPSPTEKIVPTLNESVPQPPK